MMLLPILLAFQIAYGAGTLQTGEVFEFKAINQDPLLLDVKLHYQGNTLSSHWPRAYRDFAPQVAIIEGFTSNKLPFELRVWGGEDQQISLVVDYQIVIPKTPIATGSVTIVP